MSVVCRNCQAENDEERFHCSSCGRKLSSVIENALFRNRYDVGNLIFEDAAGITFLARDVQTGADCRLRELIPQSADRGVVRRFMETGRHYIDAGILCEDGCFTHDRRYYLIEPSPEGVSLAAERAAGRSPESILNQILELLDGIPRGISHGDIRARNIVRRRDTGVWQLVEWAYPKDITQAAYIHNGNITLNAGHIPAWAPPERRQFDLRPVSDIYCAAAAFLEVYTGRPCEELYDATRLRWPLEDLNLPEAVRTLTRMLAPAAKDRPPDTAAVRKLLKEHRARQQKAAAAAAAQQVETRAETSPATAAAAAAPAPAPQPPPPVVAPKLPPPAVAPKKTRTIPLLLATGTGVLLVVAAVLLYLHYSSPERSVVTAIDRGNLVEPRGASAFDYYQQAKQSGSLSNEMRARIARKAIPVLEKNGEATLRQYHDTSVDTDWGAARNLYAWAAELDPSNTALRARAAYTEGQLSLRSRKFQQAAISFQEAANLAGCWSMAHNALGRVAAQQMRYSEAAGHYLTAIRCEPTWIYPRQNLCVVFSNLRNYAAAEEQCQAALNIDPSRPVNHFRLGQVYEVQRRFCDAIPSYQRAIEKAQPGEPNFDPQRVRDRIGYLSRRHKC